MLGQFSPSPLLEHSIVQRRATILPQPPTCNQFSYHGADKKTGMHNGPTLCTRLGEEAVLPCFSATPHATSAKGSFCGVKSSYSPSYARLMWRSFKTSSAVVSLTTTWTATPQILQTANNILLTDMDTFAESGIQRRSGLWPNTLQSCYSASPPQRTPGGALLSGNPVLHPVYYSEAP